MLTKRQAEVLKMVSRHMSSPEIAKLLGLSKRTIDMHIMSAMDRLGAKNRYHAAELAKSKENKISYNFIDQLVDEETMIKFIEIIPFPVAMLDSNLRYIAHSRNFSHIFVDENKELIGQTHYQLFPKVKSKQKKIFESCLNERISKNIIEKFQLPDGVFKKLKWEIQPWNTSGNPVGGIILSYQLIQELPL